MKKVAADRESSVRRRGAGAAIARWYPAGGGGSNDGARRLTSRALGPGAPARTTRSTPAGPEGAGPAVGPRDRSLLGDLAVLEGERADGRRDLRVARRERQGLAEQRDAAVDVAA